MGSELFKNFLRKAVLNKQGPPGGPPRPGLQWKPQTHRWIRPQSGSQGVGDFMSGFVGNLDIEPKSTALRNAKPIERALKEQFGDFNFKSGYPDLESEGLANLAEHLGTEVNQDLVEKVAGGVADQAIELEEAHYAQSIASASSDTTPTTPTTPKPTNPKLQGIMNERLEEYISDGFADLGAYEIGQNMDLATKIHNEVLLDDGKWGKTVFEDAGIAIEDTVSIGFDEMDNLVANAMEHHGITNVTPEDYEDDEDYPFPTGDLESKAFDLVIDIDLDYEELDSGTDESDIAEMLLDQIDLTSAVDDFGIDSDDEDELDRFSDAVNRAARDRAQQIADSLWE